MKRMIYVTSFIICLLVCFLGITYSYEYDKEDNLTFELIGPETLYIDVDKEYKEYGIKVVYNNQDISSLVEIDSSMVDTSKLGGYKVKYSVNHEGNTEHIYRDVIVIDKEKPVIELLGDEVVYILLNGNYYEYGYKVKDNYDEDLEDKVKVSGKVNASSVGEYTLTYSVADNSGNTSEVSRKVVVKKPVITVDSQASNRFNPTTYNATMYSNTIIKNTFNSNGVYYEGYVNDSSNIYKIKLKNRENSLEYLYNMSVSGNNYYKGNLDLTTVKNGIYDLYIIGNIEEKLQNKMNVLSKLVRSKIGNKLVTFTYDNDYVSIEISDFKYEYDFVIDPGHGGSDIGASNGLVLEKNLNLKISKYEKCRYESMGYKVYMVRYDDTYGEMLGSSSLNVLDRRGLTIGYYGAVSRVAYSNHHNGSLNPYAYGFEIIVSNQATRDDLVVEMSLYNKYRKLYGISDNLVRLYSKDYDTDTVYNKINGAIYSNTNYYAVIRIPYELFNVDNIIYEPIYLSNSSDFNWYYSSSNWIKVAEIKIEEYVNYLGGTYNKDNSMCL